MATSARAGSVHQSAKMMEAQAYFQQVVKQELQVLLASGVEREVAVKTLLHRIVQSTEEPEDADVKRVMRQFQMNYDDAMRALIVKQEIGRLKRQGLDAFAAIEELTRKMQLPSRPDVEVNEDQTPEASSCEAPAAQLLGEGSQDELRSRRSDSEGSERDSQGGMESSIHEEDEEEDTEAHPAAADESASIGLSSLSLCQQIDKFSISRMPAASLLTSSPSSERRDPRSSSFSLFSSSSRKRRAQRAASPSPDRDQVVSPRPSSAPASPTPSSHTALQQVDDEPQDTENQTASHKRKKQRMWDSITSSFATAMSLKNTGVPPESPTAVSSSDDDAQPRTSRGKRSRSSDRSTPLFDVLELADPLFHHTKRHKS